MAERVTKSVVVKADPSTVYDLWSDFENFPHFMKYVESVNKTGQNRSTWIVSGPLGRKVEWQAETTRHDPPQRIAWNTKDSHSEMTTSGEVIFSPLPHDETEVTVTFQYVPPAGKIGEVVTDLFANPEARIDEDLRNFKAYAEGMLRRIQR